MNVLDWKGALQRLAEKTARKPAKVRAGTGISRPVYLEGCALQGRPPLPLELELQLYYDMRRTFPVLDVAVTRLVQLCGHPRVEGPAAVREELQDWLEQVPAGPGQRGLGSWLETHLDHMLVYGKGVGQVVLSRSRREVAAVFSVDPREIRLEAGADPLSLRVLRRAPGCYEAVELPPSLTLLSLHAAQGNPDGTSMLRSLPFAAEVCSIIQNATAQVWQRMGSPSFHVTWDPGEGVSDTQGVASQGITAALEHSFGDMMRARGRGEVRDWFTAGDVRVSLIGSQGTVLSVQEPLRAFTEQMVAVTGLPPWLLGLHWSSTERLSVQQADLLIAGIEALRREAQPALEALLDLRQRLRGRAPSGSWRLVWPPVDLRDATEQARAAAWAEQARQRRIENARRMWELGFWSQERAARDADETLAAVDRSLEAPPGGASPVPARLTPAGEEE